MSMKEYAYYDCGLMLAVNYDEHEKLMAQIAQISGRTPDDVIEDFNDDPVEFAENLPFDACIIRGGDESMAVLCPIDEDGIPACLDEELDSEYIMVPVSLHLWGQEYATRAELVESLKDKVRGYVPEDFSYEDHIYLIVGSYWG